jgi:hypothetical protein
MKVFLMHSDQDFDLHRDLPANEEALTRDLELNTLFGAMAAGDAYLFGLAQRAVLQPGRSAGDRLSPARPG